MASDVAGTGTGAGTGGGGPHENAHCAQAVGPVAARRAIVSMAIRQQGAARGRRVPRRRPGEMASISKVKIPSPPRLCERPRPNARFLRFSLPGQCLVSQ